jgi:hypothetical protein
LCGNFPSGAVTGGQSLEDLVGIMEITDSLVGMICYLFTRFSDDLCGQEFPRKEKEAARQERSANDHHLPALDYQAKCHTDTKVTRSAEMTAIDLEISCASRQNDWSKQLHFVVELYSSGECDHHLDHNLS